MRKLRFLLVILLILVLGGNYAAERVASSALSDAARDTLGVKGPVKVKIQGFPVLLDVLSGRVKGISFSVSDERFDDLTFRELKVALERLTYEGSIFGDGPLSIHVDSIRVAGWTDEKAINAFLERRGEDARVKFKKDVVTVTAKRNVAGSQRTFTATGPLTVEGNSLRFDADEVSWDGPSFPGAERLAGEATSFEERLPELPLGIKVTGVNVSSGRIDLVAGASAQSIKIR